jgi:glutamine synthetase
LGVDYTSYYAGVKAEEWRQYNRSISQWEIAEYLKTY